MTPLRFLTTVMLAIVLVLVTVTSAFPLDQPVVRRAYYSDPSTSHNRPALCGLEWHEYMKCYLCAKALGDKSVYDRCCDPLRFGGDINGYCELITRNT